MNLRDNLIESLSGEDVEITPVISVTQVGIVEAMENTNAFWPDAHTDADKMAKLGSSLYELVGLECARIPFDLTVEADALGCRVDIGNEDRTPQVTKSPFDSSRDIKVPEDFLERGRIPVVLEAIDKLKGTYGNLPIIVGMTGPLTLAGQLLGIENLVRYMRSRPNEVEDALDEVLEASFQYAEAISSKNPDVICVADPTSAPDLIDPLQFKNMVKPRLEDLSNVITTNKVLHICGSTEPIIRDMATTGFDGLSVEEKVDIARAKEEIKGGGKTIRVGGRTMSMGGGDKTPKLVGNISTNQTLFMGSTDDVKAEVKSVLEAGVDILAPSCGLAPRSPLANIKAMIEARNEFYGI
ncbi:methylcobamide:CoM methyltransferase MtaA [Methanobacterium sp. ACI-7]|uniref:methylcobamide:CoM methyltransferase MtaA n=1 Tax=unclassified Methanobacterium TaxID=2627676 RepID=UPI0039C0747C